MNYVISNILFIISTMAVALRCLCTGAAAHGILFCARPYTKLLNQCVLKLKSITIYSVFYLYKYNMFLWLIPKNKKNISFFLFYSFKGNHKITELFLCFHKFQENFRCLFCCIIFFIKFGN